MFQKLADFYTQKIRIDLIPAERLAQIDPGHARYRSAADRGAFVVSVLQGEILEGVYAACMEDFFDTLAEAQEFYDQLITANPDADHFDFVSHPPGEAAHMAERHPAL